MRFKRIVSLICLVFMSGLASVHAQNEILGIAREDKTTSYYQEQAGLWENIVNDEPENSWAWYQLYKANRAILQKSEPDLWAKDQSAVFEKLQPLIKRSEPHISDAFEYYLMSLANSRGEESRKSLFKAYEIDSDRPEIYESLLVEHVATGNKSNATEVARKMFESNYYSNANYKWNYNGLSTVAQNGIYMASGDMDAIPKWVLQNGLGIREDIKVISKHLLAYRKDYRQMVFSDLGIPEFVESEALFPDHTLLIDGLVKHLLIHANRPVYMGCGTNVASLKRISVHDKMFLVGLCFKYDEHDCDNNSETIRLYDHVYELEYLMNDFQVHSDDEIVRKYMNMTYLPSLIKVVKHFQAVGDTDKYNEYHSLLMKIARESGREAQIKSLF